ncbi:MAG: hypothetical protein WKG01_31730 [Kofleriaceae bacterium]
MYCSLDKIDLAAQVDGREVALQTDHRTTAEIEAEPELSALYAMTRVLNAREHLTEAGHPDPTDAVRYVVSAEPPAVLIEALRAVGATLEHGPQRGRLGELSQVAIGELADRSFRALAKRAARRVGTRDLAIALRMLEDQTLAEPPLRTDEEVYWQRVLELSALLGELLRAKYPGGRWAYTDRSLVPFGFQLAGGSTVMFPTNRAQRVIEDGADESLFKLLLAAEETIDHPPDAATGRLMPSLRHRGDLALDEVVWRALLDEPEAIDLPVVVCGVDGETTFGMVRKDAIDRPADEAMAAALENLADEQVEIDSLQLDELSVRVVTGSFYAAEKLLDRAFMRKLHVELADSMLVAAVPARGLLVVAPAHGDRALLGRFVSLVAMHFEESGGRAISASVMLVTEGRVAGFVQTEVRPDPETPELERPGLLRRLFGRR